MILGSFISNIKFNSSSATNVILTSKLKSFNLFSKRIFVRSRDGSNDKWF